MAVINILDKNTVNKIAAGEVIEGPSAVVKELVENAIDAQANSVTVEIKEGGTSLIRVTDNGKGIGSDDIKTAFLEHATSKIRTEEDLNRITSLGFRGEALASIAAVSEVEALSKTAEEISGVRYVIEGGEEKELQPAGVPEGTTFIIKNLFYNTPARKKFLKTAATEGRYVQEVMEHMAVSHPEIAFKFILNGKLKLQTPGNGKLKDVIFYMYGKETASSLVEIIDSDDDETLNGLKIKGYIGKPSFTRGNREYENYFINGRFIKNKVITRAIEDAYKAFLMQHRYPFTCLLINIGSSEVDVNVHPAKLEVRFSDPDSIYRLVFNAVDKALRYKDIIPDMAVKQPSEKNALVREFKKDSYTIPDIPMPEPFEKNRQNEWKREIRPLFKQESFIAEKGEYGFRSFEGTTEKSDSDNKDVLTDMGMNYIDKNLTNDALNVNPDKDISESINIDKKNIEHWNSGFNEENKEDFKNRGYDNGYSDDNKEIRHNVRVNNTSEAVFSEKAEEFKGGILAKKALPDIKMVGQLFGTYWIMEFDGKAYMIDQHAAHEKVMYERFVKMLAENKMTSQNLLPPVIISLSPAQKEIAEEISVYLNKLGFELEDFGGKEYAIKAVPTELYGLRAEELLTDILDQYSLEGRQSTPDTVLSKIATMACKAAIKGNTVISEAEAKALIEELMELDNPYNCPHGRPTMIFMSKGDIEKKFKRQV